MTTSSGAATYIPTRGELIQGAFRQLKVLREGDVPNSAQTSYAVSALQMLLKNLSAQGLMLWTYYQVAVPLVISQKSYTIGPTGADVTATRPLRLFDGSFVRSTVAGVVTDVDLTLLTRQAYFQQSTKAVTGTTSSIYYFPGIDVPFGPTNGGTGYGTLYVYFPTDANSTYTAYCNMMRPLYDMGAATDAFDLPAEWMRALKYMLAADMAYEYQVDPQTITFLEQKAKAMHQMLTEWQYDQALVAFGEERSRQERARDATTNVG